MAILNTLSVATQGLVNEVAGSTYLILGFYKLDKNIKFKFLPAIPIIIPIGSAINPFVFLENIKTNIGTTEKTLQTTEYIDDAIPKTFEYEVITKQITLDLVIINPKNAKIKNIRKLAKDTLNIALINKLNGYLEKLVSLNGRIVQEKKALTEKDLQNNLTQELQNKLISIVSLRLTAFNMLLKSVTIDSKESDELLRYNLTLANIIEDRKSNNKSVSSTLIAKYKG